MKKKVLSVVLALCLTLGSAAMLPENSFVISTGINASANEGAVIETKDICYKELADGTLEVFEYIGEGGDVTIPQTVGGQTVTSIGEYAFRNGKNYYKVTSVQMPDTITSIGDRAFFMCSKIKKINLSQSLKSIGAHAFGYTDVDKLTLPEGLTNIGENAFEYCTCLTEITIPGSVKSVGTGAFFYCKNLEKATINEGTMRLMSGAFFGCYKLSQVSLPSTLLTIGANAFLDNYALKSIDIPENVVQIGSGAFNRCKALEKINLPESITSLGERVFEDCESLKSITIPSSVTEIADETFEGCSSLSSVTFKGKITSIGSSAFKSCGFKSIDIPESVTQIGSSAFMSCKSLTSIKIPSKVTSISRGIFEYCDLLESVSIPDGVTEIKDYAFELCKKLKNINLPSKLKTIGKNAFLGCESLTSLVLPNSLTSIGENAFYQDTNLKSILVPKSVSDIGHDAFGILYVDGKRKKNEGLILKCYKNSEAEKYASEYSINYELLDVKHYPAKKVTCTTDGNIEYWMYNSKYYSNPKATNEISKDKVFIKATGHKWSDWAITGVNKANGTSALTRTCSVCKTKEIKSTIQRIAGANRFATAAEISKASFKTANTVVLAYGLNYADALAGVTLANKLNAPILLTHTAKLPDETQAEIKRLGAKKVIILGGTGAISKDVENSLKKNGLTTERYAGTTRFGTATAIAEKLNDKPTDVFFVYAFNYADALSVSTVAALKNAPIIYLKTNGELDDDTAKYLTKLKKAGSVKNAYVIGGEGVISKDMLNKAGKALGVTPTRVAGKNRYATCTEVNNKFKSVLTGSAVCVAKGLDFPDALAGGVFAAQQKAPLFLADNTLKDEQKTYLKDKKADTFYVFGGTGAVPDKLVTEITTASK